MMKLTKHQKQIVDKIVEGKVYDITSYLRGFEKVHEQKYDIQEIEKTFNSAEEDKKYSFSEKESYFYTQVYDACGKNIGIYKVADTLTYKFKDYPLVKPVKAKLTNSIDRVIVPYKDQKYTFDFCNNVLVADSFNDIKEFIALWCYLKSQALIFDVHKPVIEEDLGLFFELKSQKIRKEPNPTWKVNTVIESKGETVNETESHSELVPYKNINDYIEKNGKLMMKI